MKEFTTDNFQQEVLESDIPVLVDFFTPNCGPCKQIAPVVEQLAAEAGGRFRVGKIHAFEQQALAIRYHISAVPTLLIVKDGEVVRTLVGYHDKRRLLAAMQEILDQPVSRATV